MTAELVVWKIICSLPFASPMNLASLRSMSPAPLILFEFKSKLPPNCGVSSSTMFDILPATPVPAIIVLRVIF